jgi:hypothetical protein
VGVALTALLVACSSPPANPAVPVAPATATLAAPAAAATDTTVTDIAAPVGAQATLLVQLDDVRTQVRSVTVTAPISGLALLQQSGLAVETADFSWGTAVCSIAGVGCPADDCFCGGDTFWNYAYWNGDSWQGYEVGPAQSVISQTGALEGWRWGTFEGATVDPARVLAAQAAQSYLRAQQVITDGSYAGNASSSVESLLALGSNQPEGALLRAAPEMPSLLDFVQAHAAAYSRESVAGAGKLSVALAATATCWPADALTPAAYYSPTLGSLATDAGPLAWGLLGSAALEEPIAADSVAYLTALALPEGGWEWSPGWGADSNSTALALQALVAAGVPVTTTEVISGLAFLQEVQTPSGGFPYSAGGEADANSTAYGVQALIAVGQDSATWQQADGGPVDYLMAQQGADGGIAWQAAQPANVAATQQALPALLGLPYPLRRAALPPCEAQP